MDLFNWGESKVEQSRVACWWSLGTTFSFESSFYLHVAISKEASRSHPIMTSESLSRRNHQTLDPKGSRKILKRLIKYESWDFGHASRSRRKHFENTNKNRWRTWGLRPDPSSARKSEDEIPIEFSSSSCLRFYFLIRAMCLNTTQINSATETSRGEMETTHVTQLLAFHYFSFPFRLAVVFFWKNFSSPSFSCFFSFSPGATYMLMKLEIMPWFMLITLKIESRGINLDVYEKALSSLLSTELSEKFSAVLVQSDRSSHA